MCGSHAIPGRSSGDRLSLQRWVRRALPLLGCLAGPYRLAPAQAPTQELTPSLAITLRGLTGLEFSPDGAQLAFVVSEPPSGTTRARHVWLLDVATQTVRQYTNSRKSETEPHWSPDGRLIAFLSDRDEFDQIYLMRTDGGEAWPLTKGQRGVQTFAWAPDGTDIAFLARDERTEAEQQKRTDKDDARVVDQDDKRTRLWLVAVPSGEARPLTAPDWQVSSLTWTPTGDRIIISATEHPESDQHTNRIYAVNPADGRLAELAAPRGSFGDLVVAPTGAAVYYVGCRVDGPEPHDLWMLPLTGGAARDLTVTLDRPIEQTQWRPDGSLLALVQDGFRNRFVSLSAAGTSSPLTEVELNPSTFALARSGHIALVGQTATEPPELYLWDGAAPPQRVSRFNASWRAVSLTKPQHFTYTSFDGQSVEAALLTPTSFTGASPVPLIALIHGGPTGAWRDGIEAWGQLLVARGYAIFYPNVRGSTGYGQRFMEANRGDWGGGDFKDIMAGIDSLIARGIADPNRLGIGGWSYGGYMAEWAITQTTRFKAAVSGAGMANLISEFGTEGSSAYDEWFYGLPWEQPEGFLKSSPFMYLKHARTPTLILQGEEDPTDPIGQSQELYRGLKRYGVETDFVLYPREPHGLREEKHLVDRLTRIVAWFDKYLKPDTASTR